MSAMIPLESLYNQLLNRLTLLLGFEPEADIFDIFFHGLLEQNQALETNDGDLVAYFQSINRWFEV